MPERDVAAAAESAVLVPAIEQANPVPAGAIGRVLALQRTAGNAAVARLLKGDHAEPSEPTGPAPAAPATASAAAPGSEGPAGEETEEQSGEIEAIEGEEITTGGCDAPLSRLGRALPALGGDVRVSPHVTLDVAHRQAPARGAGAGKGDAINHAISIGSQLTEDASAPGAGEFGVEKVKYKIDNIKWTHRPATKTVDVNARVFLDITWGVHSLGRTNVPSAADAVVTSATWKAIADDLRPDGTGRPTRSTYWAEDLTRKHENFHASDDIGRATLYLPTARTWLSAQTVSAGSVEADVKAHLETMRGKIEADGWAWYGTGGEDRAYADGKSSYASRVAGIEAAAAAKKW
ncbi:MAG TPA: hypothetical protein VNS09_07590 [Solirubrobacter sp.]|nr:hypothetical protein [Solirubrobacter sp.]